MHPTTTRGSNEILTTEEKLSNWFSTCETDPTERKKLRRGRKYARSPQWSQRVSSSYSSPNPANSTLGAVSRNSGRDEFGDLDWAADIRGKRKREINSRCVISNCFQYLLVTLRVLRGRNEQHDAANQSDSYHCIDSHATAALVQ